MTKADIAARIADKLSMTRNESAELTDHLFELMKQVIVESYEKRNFHELVELQQVRREQRGGTRLPRFHPPSSSVRSLPRAATTRGRT